MRCFRQKLYLQILHYLIMFASFSLAENPLSKNVPKYSSMILRSCGNNLNQIATYLNDGRPMTNQMWKDIKDCISELCEMRDDLKEMVDEYHSCN